jgi:hypothetical protein
MAEMIGTTSALKAASQPKAARRVGLMGFPAPDKRTVTGTGRFLVAHRHSFVTLNLRMQGRISDFEDESLLRASGWKTNRPSP